MTDHRLDAAGKVFEVLGVEGPSEIVRDGLSLLVRRSEVLLRVRDRSAEPVAAREVEVARALQESGVSATRLVDESLLVEGSCVVTAWRWYDVVRPSTPTDCAVLARSLRERTRDHFGVSRFDPLGAARNAVAHIEIGDAHADFVRLRAFELAERWAAIADTDPAGTVIVHGDLHGDNVLVANEGPILADLELAGVGPASFDTAPAAVAVKRYGADQSVIEQFVEAQKFDPRSWDGFATCIEAYELWVTGWAVGVRERSGELRDEAQTRVRCLRDGSCEPWKLL